MTAKKKKTTVSRPRVTKDELAKFVIAYQESSSLAETAEKMGWKIEKVRTQATRLRKLDVPLKEYNRQGLTAEDISDLAELCSDAAPDPD